MDIKIERSQLKKLQARRQELLASLVLPPQGLPGSLAKIHRRCGEKTCHCSTGEGHPCWTLTYMAEGKKRVDYVSHDMVEEVRRGVEEGNAYKQGVAELMAVNAQILWLERRERKRREADEKRGARR